MNTMPNARQIPRPPLSDQIAEVMLVREAYQKRATDLTLKRQLPDRASMTLERHRPALSRPTMPLTP
jgi:hypothetical protein